MSFGRKISSKHAQSLADTQSNASSRLLNDVLDEVSSSPTSPLTNLKPRPPAGPNTTRRQTTILTPSTPSSPSASPRKDSIGTSACVIRADIPSLQETSGIVANIGRSAGGTLMAVAAVDPDSPSRSAGSYSAVAVTATPAMQVQGSHVSEAAVQAPGILMPADGLDVFAKGEPELLTCRPQDAHVDGSNTLVNVLADMNAEFDKFIAELKSAKARFNNFRPHIACTSPNRSATTESRFPSIIRRADHRQIRKGTKISLLNMATVEDMDIRHRNIARQVDDFRNLETPDCPINDFEIIGPNAFNPAPTSVVQKELKHESSDNIMIAHSVEEKVIPNSAEERIIPIGAKTCAASDSKNIEGVKPIHPVILCAISCPYQSSQPFVGTNHTSHQHDYLPFNLPSIIVDQKWFPSDFDPG